MVEEYIAIRDRLTTDITYAWELTPDQIIWVTGQEELEPDNYPSVVIRRDDATIEPLGAQNDVEILKFIVGARFKILPGTDLDLFTYTMVHNLRPRIVYPHYTECTYDPRVVSHSHVLGEPGDKFVELEMTVTMNLVAARSTGSGGTDPPSTLPQGDVVPE